MVQSNTKRTPLTTMAIQRRNDSSPSEADSYERATAFLSDWIEDSLLVPTVKASAAHRQPQHQHHRLSVPNSPQPPPDLPSSSGGTLRRRNSVSNDGGGNTNNNGAINSLVNSLRTSLMMHENLSPLSVGALHKESKHGGDDDSIPPLPFGARLPTVVTQEPLGRDHHQQQQGGGAAATSQQRAAASGSRHVPRSSLRRASSSGGGGERRRSIDDAAARSSKSSQSEDIIMNNKHGSSSKHHSSSCSSKHEKNNSSKKRPSYTRRHTLDCDRSFTSSSIAERTGREDGGVLYSSMRSLHDSQRCPTRRHVHWPDRRSDDDLLGGSNPPPHRSSSKKEDPPTMVVSLPWTDHTGNVGHYTGQVNSLIQPHGSGALQYDFPNYRVVKGVWNNGNPATSTSSPKSSPVLKKEVIKGVNVTLEAVGGIVPPSSRKSGDEKKSPYKPKSKLPRKKSSRVPTTMEGSITMPSSPASDGSLDRLSDLNGPPIFDLGDTLCSSKHQIIESNPAKALNLINQLHIHDFAWILRSSREWTYAIVADFPVQRGEEASIRFVIDKLGNTKTLKVKHWAKCIRLVDQKSH